MPRRIREPYHHGDLRRTLLDAAERLIVESGIDQVSLRAIARAAGVSHAAPYHHFDDLEGLLAAVAASGFTRLRDTMFERAHSNGLLPLEGLREAGIAYVRFAAENPELFRLMFSGRMAKSKDLELLEASSGAYATLGELLGRAGLDENRVRSAGSEEAARTLWATVHGLATLIIDDRLDVDRTDPVAVENAARDVTKVLGLGLVSLIGA